MKWRAGRAIRNTWPECESARSELPERAEPGGPGEERGRARAAEQVPCQAGESRAAERVAGEAAEADESVARGRNEEDVARPWQSELSRRRFSIGCW